MSTDTVPAFNPDAVGAWGDPVQFAVERERIAAYAAATNDPLPAHVAGDLAPPVFAIVPAFQSLGTAMLGVVPGELLGAVLHGEQDFHFHRPIERGDELVTRSQAIGIRQRSSGVTVAVRGETRDRSGAPVVEQYMTSFVRGAQGALEVGDVAPRHSFDEALRAREPAAEVFQTFDADQTFRYAQASGDPMQIHLDEQFAKAVGLPGIIIHGLCTMAFTSVAVIGHACPEDPSRLRRLAVRFARIVQPEQTITTRIWEAGERDGRSLYAYETSADTGDVVIKDGLAEVA